MMISALSKLVRNWQLRTKIGALNLFSVAAALILAGSTFLIFLFFHLRNNTGHELELVTDTIATEINAAILFEDAQSANRILSNLSHDPRIRSAGVFLKNRKLLAAYSADSKTETNVRVLPDRAKSIQFFGQNILIQQPVTHKGETLGFLVVQASIANIYHAFGIYFLMIFFFAACSLTVVAISSGFIRDRLLSPIEHLSELAQKVIKKNDYSVRADVKQEDELGELARSLNQMLEAIAYRDRELEVSKEALEERVAIRTRELRAKNIALQKATELKNQFIANVSHELRTPLTGILGMSELALETKLTPEQKEYLKLVQASATTLSSLVNDILDFARMEAGQMTVNSMPFSIRSLMDRSCKILGINASEKGLELMYWIHPDVPDLLIGDANRIQQVLTNLIANSTKFTDQGEIIVECTLKNRDEEKVWIHFSVVDTGIGIPKHKQADIFRPFYQVDGTSTRKYGGTGLGLGITQKLVKLMDGELGFESELGKGSNFFFTLPFRVAGVQNHVPAAKELEFSGKSAWVFSKSARRTNILSAFLAEIGIDVITFSKKEDLRKKVLSHANSTNEPVPYVFWDHTGSSEEDSTHWAEFKTIPIHRRPPLILLFPSAEIHRRKFSAEKREPVRFLIKPISLADVRNALEEIDQDHSTGKSKNAQSETTEYPKVSGDRSVLIADDNLINQKLIAKFLERINLRIFRANNGKEAVDLFRSKPIDLILMDIQMPQLNGLNATRQIRELEKGSERRIPIIALTAHATETDRDASLQAGMNDYLTKPLSGKDLIAKVLHYLEVPAEPIPDELRGEPEPSFSANEDLESKILQSLGGDRELMEEMAREFLNHSDASMKKMKLALKNEDLGAVEQIAHSLKGSSGYLCLSDFENLMRQLEKYSHDGDIVKIQQLMPEVEIVFSKVSGFLRQF